MYVLRASPPFHILALAAASVSNAFIELVASLCSAMSVRAVLVIASALWRWVVGVLWACAFGAMFVCFRARAKHTRVALRVIAVAEPVFCANGCDKFDGDNGFGWITGVVV